MASIIRGNDNFDSGVVGSTTYGAVGTYALLYYETLGTNAPGTTASGSYLYPSNTYNYYLNKPTYSGSGRPSGTWRLMGQTGYYNNTTVLARIDFMNSVWVRIS